MIPPVKVLAPERINSPVPSLSIRPVPPSTSEITPLRVSESAVVVTSTSVVTSIADAKVLSPWVLMMLPPAATVVSVVLVRVRLSPPPSSISSVPSESIATAPVLAPSAAVTRAETVP